MMNSWPHVFDKAISLTNGARKVLRFRRSTGGGYAREIRMRVSADMAYVGAVRYKMFNRKQEASFAVDAVLSAAGVHSIRLTGHPYDGEIQKHDVVLVAGSTAAANDGEFTVRYLAKVGGKTVIYVEEAITAQAGGSATVRNTVSEDNAGSYIGAQEAERVIPGHIVEVHLLSVDAGAVGSKVHIQAFSDDVMDDVEII